MPTFNKTINLLEDEINYPPWRGNIMENLTPLIAADKSSTKFDSGHLYGFMIVFVDPRGTPTISRGENAALANTDSHPAAPLEYFFNVPPKQIIVTEPATVQIQPTMGRSYLIEHQGSLLKQMILSGTTGFRPAAKSALSKRGGARQIFSRTIATFEAISSEINDLTALVDPRGLPSNEVTGYFNFMQLRNVFRRYFALVSNPSLRPSIGSGLGAVPYLVWVNFHEFEFWICEPSSFTARRESTSPLTFSYDLSCTLLRRIDTISAQPEDWYKYLVNAYTYLDKMEDLVSRLSSIVRQVNQLDDALLGDAVGLVRRFSRTMRTAASAVATSVQSYRNFRLFDDVLREQTLADLRAVNDAFDQAIEAEPSENQRYSLIERGNSFKEYLRVINEITAARREQQTTNSISAQLVTTQNSYSSPGTPQTNGLTDSPVFPKAIFPNYGDRSDLRNADASLNSLYQVEIGLGEDLFMIAQRVLGDGQRWKELAVLNNLVFPYVASTAQPGVLTYGDSILVPGGGSLISQDNLVLPSAEDLGSDTEEINPENVIFGRDIRINFVSGANLGSAKLDLVIQNGDLSKIEGRNNFAQALLLVSNTERGELSNHPYYGFPVVIGKKNVPSLVAEWAIEVRRTLKAEPRVETIADLGAAVQGNIFVGRIVTVGKKSLVRVPITTSQRLV